jgi:hypothetical protein
VPGKPMEFSSNHPEFVARSPNQRNRTLRMQNKKSHCECLTFNNLPIYITVRNGLIGKASWQKSVIFFCVTKTLI